MKIAIKTLGCKVNQSESASIEGALKEAGHDIVPAFRNSPDTGRERPDVCIINTCTVTAKSDYQSRQMIRRAVKSGARVIATGCYAQTRPDDLLKIKGIDLIAGNSEKHRLHEYLDNFPVKNNVRVDSPGVNMETGPYYSNRTRAFLKIQDGCNFSCSYCAVPMARGKSRSLGEEDVLKGVKKFIAGGCKEIVLTGIHIGCYGLELQPESSLLKIVKTIVRDHPQIRLRLSSIEPQEFDREFLMMIKQNLVCPHLHIPLQSGSDNILKAMGRRYRAVFFRDLINEIVSACPDIAVGTDIIIGFPGETEKDFKETIELLEELPLSYIHVFPYSQRPGTRAVTMAGQVNNKIRKKRVNKALEIAKMKKNSYLTGQLGKTLNVIVERKEITNGFYRAISDNYIKLLVRADNMVPGRSLNVKAVSFSDGELVGVPV